ncbi:hypothetical protein [Streptomyces sp. 769]|nr:hypothetical protein [Streptomyces sp. 769]AJC60978.1 hypothetical protein GZL_08450 [Streptomyces sp. 769]
MTYLKTAAVRTTCCACLLGMFGSPDRPGNESEIDAVAVVADWAKAELEQ